MHEMMVFHTDSGAVWMIPYRNCLYFILFLFVAGCPCLSFFLSLSWADGCRCSCCGSLGPCAFCSFDWEREQKKGCEWYLVLKKSKDQERKSQLINVRFWFIFFFFNFDCSFRCVFVCLFIFLLFLSLCELNNIVFGVQKRKHRAKQKIRQSDNRRIQTITIIKNERKKQNTTRVDYFFLFWFEHFKFFIGIAWITRLNKYINLYGIYRQFAPFHIGGALADESIRNTYTHITTVIL